MKRILFIVNPKAGITIKSKAIIDLMAGNLLNSDIEPKVVFTEYGGHAIELAKKGIEEKFDVIVAGGGDGTINEVASVLKKTDAVLGLLPLGSGNGLARFLKIPLGTISAIRTLNDYAVRTIDTVTLNDRFFTSIAGVGLDAEVAHSFQSNRFRGLLEYTRVAMTVLTELKAIEYDLVIDGRELNPEALMISFANSNQFGFNMRIAPEARIDDGLIDVCIVKKGNIAHVINTGFNALAGKTDENGIVDYIKAKEILIRNNKPLKFNIDGEAALFDSDIKIRIHPNSLKVAVPLRIYKA